MSRYAPSPTGRFHVGNLRTAWISREWSRALGEPWVVRFEDIDKPRVVPGAQAEQLKDMASLGLVPDVIQIQSEFSGLHWAFFEKALSSGKAYPCTCSRREVQEALSRAASAPHGAEALYAGACRELDPGRALPERVGFRFKGSDPSGSQDFLIAHIQGAFGPESFTPAYHWACAIDDWQGKHRLLVRAWDLEGAALQQRAIQHWLAESHHETFAPPAIFHASLITQNDGHRLEKRTQGTRLSELVDVDLLALFAGSFAGATGFEPGKIWGEPKKTMTLQELGLCPDSHRA